MTILILAIGGAAVLLGWLLGLTISRERRRSRLGTAFGPETKGLADVREAGRTAHTVREVGALHPPRSRG
jgi:hypothetical protein